MQHVRIAVYRLVPGSSAEEVLSKAQAGMLPIFRSEPGFVGYGVVTVDEDTLISLSIWNSPEEAEAAVEFAAEWVKENITQLIQTVQNYVGGLSFFASEAPIAARTL
jgi:heme-degrading monooxygenase HmoA